MDTACFVKFGGNSTGGTFGASLPGNRPSGELKLQLEGGTFGGVCSEKHSIEIEPFHTSLDD